MRPAKRTEREGAELLEGMNAENGERVGPEHVVPAITTDGFVHDEQGGVTDLRFTEPGGGTVFTGRYR